MAPKKTESKEPGLIDLPCGVCGEKQREMDDHAIRCSNKNCAAY